jgi:DNA-binding ferritin-like protein
MRALISETVEAPPTDGQRDLLKRLSDGIAERAKALDQVNRQEYATVMKLASPKK